MVKVHSIQTNTSHTLFTSVCGWYQTQYAAHAIELAPSKLCICVYRIRLGYLLRRIPR